MAQYYGLLSFMFMICAVIMFDRLHNSHLWAKNLLGQSDVDRLMKIWEACQES